jgi:hypothetical protein
MMKFYSHQTTLPNKTKNEPIIVMEFEFWIMKLATKLFIKEKSKVIYKS